MNLREFEFKKGPILHAGLNIAVVDHSSSGSNVTKNRHLRCLQLLMIVIVAEAAAAAAAGGVVVVVLVEI